jgi:hypothetical protein
VPSRLALGAADIPTLLNELHRLRARPGLAFHRYVVVCAYTGLAPRQRLTELTDLSGIL